MTSQRFVFRLETVLRLRTQETDRQHQALAGAIRAVAEGERECQALQAELKTLEDSSRQLRRQGTLDAGALCHHQLYQGWLIGKLTAAQAELEQRRGRLLQERGRLAECTKRMKVIDKLRLRRWDRFQRDVKRREQTEADDMAGLGFMRGANSEPLGQGVIS